MTTTLTLDNLGLMRGGRLLLSGLSLTLESGAVLSLEGPNGAGKTSLLRAIAGFLPPAAGSITLENGSAIFRDGEERGSRIGWLGHHDGIKPQLTVVEQASFWAHLYGTDDARVAAALARFGLAALADAPGQLLSAGQRRRLAFARLLLSVRPLWLLDEPLSALDEAGRGQAAGAIAAHAAAGGIVIAATHEPLGVTCQNLILRKAMAA
ncbi:MAG: heme ABC exporter ATP-binding protein CcmA [Rhizomicrobium sp.]|nr:heme ABC exporter ATP-binding protein CcmA [Rhizomicrobium sp.]